MQKNLVIVESPAKAKTIKKFLGNSYTVIASNGHVRDLPKSALGIDVENDYEPKYITIRGKGDILTSLKKEVKKADKVYLATDPDREGEAISWHLKEVLKLDDTKSSRITFNEITKNAVKNAIKEGREINMDLVDAQQTRRILDRMVGYSISPVLWAKAKRGLSAGRVQSVVLRMLCDKEDEVNEFIPEEYWNVSAKLTTEGLKKGLLAAYYGNNGKHKEICSEKEFLELKSKVTGKEFVVSEVKESQRQKKQPLPFTTSTLQQEASTKLNFSTSKTMRLAQELYEGVDVPEHGTIGLITYLRTDSTRIAKEADEAVRAFITEKYGADEVCEKENEKTSGRKIQDAHEAIRPTYVDIDPESIKDALSRDMYKLYKLIWRRFVASRMKPAVYQTATATIEANGEEFRVNSSKRIKEGFLTVYSEDEEQVDKDSAFGLTKDMKFKLEELVGEKKFTQPPARYTEASLVKTLEEKGIGRPSTYAPTITTILGRRYAVKENKNLYITDLGRAVNQIMTLAFPMIIDINFTANMEMLLDGVETGDIQWKTIVRNFYPDLMGAVSEANKNLEHIKIEDESTDVVCDVCGRKMVIKYGRHGKFLACPGFPDCRNTKSYLETIGVACPICGKDIVIRRTKKGREYFGCEDNPKCEYVSWLKPSDKKCPNCGKLLYVKGKKLVCGDNECGYITDNSSED